MESQEGSLGFGLMLVLLVPFALGYLLPRFSAYFLGPAILVLAAVAVTAFHDLFVPFHSDGSPAGMLVPAMMWAFSLGACISGGVLILTGGMRIRLKRTPMQPAAPEGQAPVSKSYASFLMFNVALVARASILIGLVLFLSAARRDRSPQS